VDEPKREAGTPAADTGRTRQRDCPGPPNEDGSLAWPIGEERTPPPRKSPLHRLGHDARGLPADAALSWGAAAQDQRAAIGGGKVNVEHLEGGELVAHGARREASGLSLARRMTCRHYCKESSEVGRFDAVLTLVAIGRSYRSSLRFLNATSISTSWMQNFHSLAGSSSHGLVRSRLRPSRRRAFGGLSRLSAKVKVASCSATSTAIRRHAAPALERGAELQVPRVSDFSSPRSA
jgi:hypothetical protein